ncbi:MAG: bifunctional heptose 7-phosphate kinase/heptose 1-phosphate adenyltransferase [Candidatus Muiribacteriota bacterium]
MKTLKRERLIKILNEFSKLNILVYGDLMVDEFIFSSVNRISPEAPVPVAEVEDKKYILGGASNVGANVKALGGGSYLSGVLGDDGFGRLFCEKAGEYKINIENTVFDPQRPTTVKTRIIAHNQQIARVDNEKRTEITEKLSDSIFSKINSQKDKFDAVIVSDYAKGTVSVETSEKIKKIFNRKIKAIDPKIKKEKILSNFDYIKPNLKEASDITGINIKDEKSLFNAGDYMFDKFSPKAVIITRGPKGITVIEKENDFTIPTTAKKVYDVTGAGDTTIAAFVMAVASGADHREAAIISNIAAGIVVGEVGTATVSKEKIIEAFDDIMEGK